MQPTEGGKALSEEEAKDLINLVDPNGTKIVHYE
jgi:hypothetical protein